MVCAEGAHHQLSTDMKGIIWEITLAPGSYSLGTAE